MGYTRGHARRIDRPARRAQHPGLACGGQRRWFPHNATKSPRVLTPRKIYEHSNRLRDRQLPPSARVANRPAHQQPQVASSSAAGKQTLLQSNLLLMGAYSGRGQDAHRPASSQIF